MRRRSIPLGVALCALALGCHHEVEMLPLVERTIYVTDKFYDVQALSKDRAFVVGYGGKILETTNGGNSWDVRPSGTSNALYGIEMVDEQQGWVVGQEGLVLHTADGGKTWTPQDSNSQPNGQDLYDSWPFLSARTRSRAGLEANSKDPEQRT